jgi:hypothetical protein
MVESRTLTALVGLLGSLALSAALYLYTGSLLFFLFVPFVPFLFRAGGAERADRERPPARKCSRCGFRTRDPEFEYCPRAGSRLHEPREDRRGRP